MIFSSVVAPDKQLLDQRKITEALYAGLDGRYSNSKVLVLIPDHTRSLPLPILFRQLVEVLHDAKQLDFMVALGTHPPLSEAHLNELVGISSEERTSKYRNIGIFNHKWDRSSELLTIGSIDQDEMKILAKEYFHPSLPKTVPIRINRAVQDYDQILVVGPTFPHEVAGFSGGAKYLFPGISGPEMIHATHWLGALAGVVGTIGIKHTPVRCMIDAATKRLTTPVVLLSLVIDGLDIAGIFIGDLFEPWERAADASAERNIIWHCKPFNRALARAPKMYDELWTAAKAMYKTEPVMAHGGEVIIFAPHLSTISDVHGMYIKQIGYHILPYFLQDWDRFKNIPLGVLAHSTHVRGSGHMEYGLEKANVSVTLSSQIPLEECARLNLGYLDPSKVRIEDWQDREEKGILYIPKAGEVLNRLRS